MGGGAAVAEGLEAPADCGSLVFMLRSSACRVVEGGKEEQVAIYDACCST